jgi:hypothetical protein
MPIATAGAILAAPVGGFVLLRCRSARRCRAFEPRRVPRRNTAPMKRDSGRLTSRPLILPRRRSSRKAGIPAAARVRSKLSAGAAVAVWFTNRRPLSIA